MKRGRVKGEKESEREVPCVGEGKGKCTRDENRAVSRGPPIHTHTYTHTLLPASLISHLRELSANEGEETEVM